MICRSALLRNALCCAVQRCAVLNRAVLWVSWAFYRQVSILITTAANNRHKHGHTGLWKIIDDRQDYRCTAVVYLYLLLC
mmetsp:Transcript_47641/g.152129  ORF Transcript_47641/g.152129 Transcript_47641/m.152129 type:complete len:80 (-) Transcript_47641:3-242(-)